jgi:hypothetical protein
MTTTNSAATNGAATNGATTARRAQRSAPVQLLGRLGLSAYGVVHLVIAYLAIRLAVTGGDQEAGKSGALRTLAQQPGGRIVLWAIAIGLAVLALWQLAEAVWGYPGIRSVRRRAVKRVANAGEAVAFVALAVSAGKLAYGGSSDTSHTQKAVTERVLALPYGQVLVGAVGVAVCVIAGFVVHRGWSRRFTEDLDLAAASPTAARTAIRLGQIGYSALGVAYAVVGALVVVVAIRHDPSRPVGLDAALQTLAGQPYGTFLLCLVAAGLVAFGAYCLLDARYRKP